MTWADLLPGDTLLNSEEYPIIVVLRCCEATNEFAWVHLSGLSAGRPVECDLKCVDMWHDDLKMSYTAVLRGEEMIRT